MATPCQCPDRWDPIFPSPPLPSPPSMIYCVQWDCPTCRERRERPQRRAQTPAALRGSDWAGGGFLKSPCVVPSDATHEKQSRGGSRRSRSKDTDRSVSGAGSNPAGTRGLKRSLSGNEVRLYWTSVLPKGMLNGEVAKSNAVPKLTTSFRMISHPLLFDELYIS